MMTTPTPPYRILTACAMLACGVPLPATAQTQSGQTTRPRSAAVVSALDQNHDGTIDTDEIIHATASLKKLDTNNDGKLTRDEYRMSPTTVQPSPSVQTPPSGETPAATNPLPGHPPTTKNPNVLVIIADDLGWNGVGFHRASTPTPNLNRLAKEGLELQRFYTYPVCSPARAAFLTGRIPLRFGIVDALGPRQAALPENATTLPSVFHDAGYQTSLIGKWHLGNDNPPLRSGFDHFYGFLGPQVDYFTHVDQRGALDWQRDGKPLDETGYSTYLLADEAIRQFKQNDSKRPFFMEIAFNAPHVPLGAPDELVAKHKSGGGIYPAVIEAMDIAIGRILTALDGQGMRDNTLVVFFSDNGASRRYSDNSPLSYGKDTIYEGGIRTPCIIRWPGQVPIGAISRQPVSVQDLLPTLAAAAGLPLSDDTMLDGSNQWPAIHTGSTMARGPFLIASHDTALIEGDWKLIQWENGRHSLFNLKSDISETKDEITNQPELAKRLMAQLAALKKDLPAAPARRTQPGSQSGRAGKPANR